MRKIVILAVLAATLVPAITASADTAAEKRMAQQIGSHLKQSGQLQNYRVQVKYQDGVAYLAGSVASAEQRDIAVRLAQQVNGVTHVICKLECPNEKHSNAGQSEVNSGGDRPELSAELDRASFEGAVNDASGVMHAYEPADQGQAAPMQPNPMMQRQIARNTTPQMRRNNMPVPSRRMPGMMPVRQASATGVYQAGCPTCNGGMGPGMAMGGPGGGPAPAGFVPAGSGRGPSYDNAQMPGYAWPSYASYPNYAALTYPQQYSPTAWPYIGPFYPYPQVPLAWRKVSLEWDDGWWFLDFSSHNSSH
jgi:BON domain